MNSPATASGLCASCGLCCNGWLFNMVELTAAEAAELQGVVEIVMTPDGARMPQPCACYDGRCNRYDARPGQCREFECRTLKAWQRGEVTFDEAAARLVHAKAAVAAVERRMHDMGWTRPDEATATAWRRFMKAHETAPDPAAFRRQHAAMLLDMAAFRTIAIDVLVTRSATE